MSLVSIPHRDRETNSALNTVTAVICSFLLYLLPLTLVTIATYTTGRYKHVGLGYPQFWVGLGSAVNCDRSATCQRTRHQSPTFYNT